MKGFKGLRNQVEARGIQKMAKLSSKKLAKNIDKEDFLEQLRDEWYPFVRRGCNIEEEVKRSRERINASAFKDTFDIVGVTDEDLTSIITEISESKPEQVLVGQKPGRNSPCPCGSGKKYKKCCGR